MRNVLNALAVGAVVTLVLFVAVAGVLSVLGAVRSDDGGRSDSTAYLEAVTLVTLAPATPTIAPTPEAVFLRYILGADGIYRLAGAPTPTERPVPVPTPVYVPPPPSGILDGDGIRAVVCAEWTPWSCAWGVKVVACESGGNPTSDSNYPYVGLWQIDSVLHAALAASLGADLYTAEGNTAVAAHLFGGRGASHWGCR